VEAAPALVRQECDGRFDVLLYDLTSTCFETDVEQRARGRAGQAAGAGTTPTQDLGR
jgi:hypothetical protein